MAKSETEKKEKPRRSGWRRVLLGVGAIVLVFGGFLTWLFLFPDKPPLTVGTDVNCQEVAMCSRSCAAKCPDGVKKLPCMTSCTKRCAKHGCEEARGPYKDMMLCVRSECLMKCISGPGPECDQCSETQCADERAVCFAQQCPGP